MKLRALRIGTSGYAYKEWRGPFYPEKIKPADMLPYYAERLSSVEINNTFYRLPKQSVLESWRDQVPEDFRFAIKASRRITHFKRLKEAEEVTAYLLDNTAVLGDRLGVLLFQLPPNLKCDLERFDAFLELLPEGTRAAFEFRHQSWEDDAVHQRLRDRNLALVQTDEGDGLDSEDAPRPELLRTADYGYLRLCRPHYAKADLAQWAADIRQTGWNESFVFFEHEDDGAGPRMAALLSEVAAPLFVPRKAVARRPARERETG